MTIPWERIRALEGQTLPTVSGRTAFDIAAVDDDEMRIVPRSSGKPRAIKRRVFERAEARGLSTVDVTPSQLREAGISEFNPAYVAAIIRAVMRQMSTG